MQKNTQQKWQCRWAPSLGALERTHQEVWGTDDHTDNDRPTVFFGLYGFPDFFTLWRHRGRRCILWAGTDITHFRNGYWLDDAGSIRLDYKALANWINKECESYVENVVEHEALREVGIDATIVPSFLGKIEEYPVKYRRRQKPRVYTSVSGNNFSLYGWHKIDPLANRYPFIEFNLYGNTVPWETKYPNVKVHGRMPKDEMNKQVMKMQGALRLVEFDGFSEILAKSILWAQWPISIIPYPHMINLSQIHTLRDMRKPNYTGREYYSRILNRYPWNRNQNGESHEDTEESSL